MVIFFVYHFLHIKIAVSGRVDPPICFFQYYSTDNGTDPFGGSCVSISEPYVIDNSNTAVPTTTSTFINLMIDVTQDITLVVFLMCNTTQVIGKVEYPRIVALLRDVRTFLACMGQLPMS